MADELDKIKKILNGDQGNVVQEFNTATTGLNLDLTVNQVPKGMLTYALNASVENFDASSVNYQNEPGNEHCLDFPEGYQVIGNHAIIEKNKHIFFLANPETNGSEIGYMNNNDCIYHTLVNADCLNFNINYPIHKVVHKISNCSTEIYWTDAFNSRRYLDLDNIPYVPAYMSDVCNPVDSNILDCNRLSLQPNFSIPQIEVIDVISGGDLTAGTYQFSAQYSDATSNGYSSYYSITNPTPIANPQITTPNFNYQVGKSIELRISNLDTSGQWQYFNLAVIKTINDIVSVELIGTYFIDASEKKITYAGQNKTDTRLSILDIEEKFPYYEIADDLTAVQDILVWKGLTSIDRINYQKIANSITLLWESYRIPANENYADELNATNLRGYLRDEVYPFEIVFLLTNGKQTDGFHIPGRVLNQDDIIPVPETNADFVGEPEYTLGNTGYSPYWKIYNTATVQGYSEGYSPASDYKGPYQYGTFSYWESTETYPCNTEVWGDLANQPIRHHKFPDVSVSPIFESAFFSSPSDMTMQKDAVYPIGIKIDISQIAALIQQSDLTQEQKDNIAGFKIIRGNRSTNKSIVAKGILRNVGKYTREENDYYFPNYPYNDLRQDPFLLKESNSYDGSCRTYSISISGTGVLKYIDCDTGNETTKDVTVGESFELCSIGRPTFNSGSGFVSLSNYGVYSVCSNAFAAGNRFAYIPPDTGIETTIWVDGGFLSKNCQTISSIITPVQIEGSGRYTITLQYEVRGTLNCGESLDNLQAFNTDESEYRYVLNSPETSFGQPFLGNVLKLENVVFGAGKSHFVQVKKHALYKLLTKEAQLDALESANRIATLTDPYNSSALFAGHQAYLTIYINGITRRNYAYSFNSIASYDYSNVINNNTSNSLNTYRGIKQRSLDIAQYLIPGVQSVGDNKNMNNFNRESSVYLRTSLEKPPLPYAEKTPSINSSVIDNSRFTLSERSDADCNKPEKELGVNVISYYASLKNIFNDQWGQIYSYETVDTGFQRDITPVTEPVFATIFGGDTFISKFAFKTKLPFFIDDRVNAPDDSDIYYDEVGNVAYPKYWFSSRSVLSNATVENEILYNFISYKAHSFDCPNTQGPDKNSPGRTFYDGKMYLYAYGVPYFYCESSYNLDLRQAFNNKEGDFWPHVNNNIPDDWVQESNVPIAQDNTYYYNVTFSKQNKENFFSHLPADWKPDLCFTYFPFRAIYSDVQAVEAVQTVNNWLIYRPVSFFDFPQNYGNLISLDGIQNRAVLARFENKSLLYNNLLTIDTSNPQAAYIGNNKLFAGAPPIDFAETDLGFVGSQNKILLKIPQGQITIDAKRGQVFLISGTQVKDLSAFGSGMNRFFTEHLPFEILNYFPKVNTDNNFSNIGLHGVYDSNYDRVIISKLDYTPKLKNIEYNVVDKKFYLLQEPLPGEVIKTEIYLTDTTYFCNKSWTLSFNMNTGSWISFHSYIPNFYIAENNFFYSGLNDCCSTIEAIVAEVVSEPSTTTTTTSSTSSTTTTTTTIFTGCDLEGIAEEITTTTTTTTETPVICYNYSLEYVGIESGTTVDYEDCESGSPLSFFLSGTSSVCSRIEPTGTDLNVTQLDLCS